LLPVLPELVLAAGAMVLLMLGAYRGQEATSSSPGLRGFVVLTGVLEFALPAGKLTTFAGSFIVDDFPLLKNPRVDGLRGDTAPFDGVFWPTRPVASSNTRFWCCSRRWA